MDWAVKQMALGRAVWWDFAAVSGLKLSCYAFLVPTIHMFTLSDEHIYITVCFVLTFPLHTMTFNKAYNK